MGANQEEESGSSCSSRTRTKQKQPQEVLLVLVLLEEKVGAGSVNELAPCLAESSCWRFWRFFPGPVSSLHSYQLMIAGPVQVGGSAANGPGPEVLGGSGRSVCGQ